ncbi:MAG: oligogalacturonate lyase family protein [Terriglobales bacterium]
MRLKISVLWITTALLAVAAVPEPPTSWIDPATGHRVVRLSRDPDSHSFYFNVNAYTAAGDLMVFTTRAGVDTLDLRTHDIHLVVPGPTANLVLAAKTRTLYYRRGAEIEATQLDTQATRTVATLPANWQQGAGLTINADETELGGSATLLTPGQPAWAPPPGQTMFVARAAAHLPMVLYTVAIGTGKIAAFYHDDHWLNHVQFSPTDPTLMLFCHEGPWDKVDRIWTIRTDGSGLRLVHRRTMPMEIAGHEFWSPDGKIVWFDLQTPRSRQFWLAGKVLATGREIRYRLTRDEWSVHFNISPNEKEFAGDGGGPQNVAHAENGQWLYLFRPRHGVLQAEKLVNMARQNYHLEPNVNFTPDGKWIVFRSNMFGPAQILAVEVAKAS